MYEVASAIVDLLKRYPALAGQEVCPYLEQSGTSAPRCLATALKPRVSTRYVDGCCAAEQHNSCQLYLAAPQQQSEPAPSLVRRICSPFNRLRAVLGLG